MFNPKFNILFYLSTVCFVFVKSDCVIKYPDNIENAPIYKKFFGEYTLELPYTVSDIVLENGDSIEATCQTMFIPFAKKHTHNYYNSYTSNIVENQTLISLNCMDNTLFYDGNILEDNVLKCKKLDWSIYENKNKHKWCKTNPRVAALLLGTKTNYAEHILAEICFDLDDWSLKTITYNASFPSENVDVLRKVAATKLQTVPLFLSTSPLGENFWNLKSTNKLILTNLELKSQIKELSQSNSWLHLANYELSPIVQGKLYENYFNEYANVLNTIWWSNLRLGNWKRFMATLENYAYNNSFQLYAGTSGVVRKPTDNIADTTADLTIKFGFKKKPVPAYIWTYLTSIDKTNKDFIIVGYNSPYAEFFSLNEIVFCPDICNEIPWLNEISKTFKYNTAGIMFCCSPESIQHSNLLDGFPMEILNSPLISITEQEYNTDIEDATTSLLSTTEETTIPNIYSTSTAVNDNSSGELVEVSFEDDNENKESDEGY